MDFSEKDAARSKWKLTQRHRRGRGRGVAPAGRGGRGGPAAARDLGTNEDRYHDEEAAAAAAAAALGPVQQSQGADLAQLLAQAEPFDRGFYYRARVNLAQELGLPREQASGSFQGLTFDLKGLATCLELLPRNQALDTDAFSDEDAGDEGGSGSEAPDELPDLDLEAEGQGGPARASEPAAAAARPASSAGARAASSGGQRRPADGLNRLPVAGSTAPGAQAAGPAPAAPAAPAASSVVAGSGDGEAVGDLLSELLGEKAAISTSGAAQQVTAAAAAAAPPPAAAAAAAGRPPPAWAQAQPVLAPQQQAAPSLPQPVRQPPRAATAAGPSAQDEHDDELDMLLGLGTAKAAAPSATVAGSSQAAPVAAPASRQEQQSLEDWLDAL